MLDIAWPELVVIGVVALVAIGPKDMPKVMRTLGRYAGKARGMMHDINRTFEQLSYETEIAEKLKAEEQQKSAAPTSAPPKPPESTHDKPAP